MSKKIAIIPALLNSTRVPNKNLMLVDGFPLIYYIVEACKKSGSFDEIYINSDDLIFKNIAHSLGVKFYHRNKSNGGTACTMKNSSITFRRDCQCNARIRLCGHVCSEKLRSDYRETWNK